MPKFFVKEDQINLTTNEIVLDTESSKHISKVLRQKVGDEIEVSNGNMLDYVCKILNISDVVTLKIITSKVSVCEFPFYINLYQGLAKGDKMDTIIQKTTELGVTNIIPIDTNYAVVKLSGDDKVNKKIDRWNKIALEAAKQSERGITPNVLVPLSLKDAIKRCNENHELAIVCYEREDNYTLKKFFEDKKLKKLISTKDFAISFFIGPEGGFAPEEIELFKQNNIELVSLGNRILRTETASLCFLSMLQYEIFD